MNFDFAEKLNPLLENLEFSNAIKIADSELKRIPETDFHAILGNSLIDQVCEVAEWIEKFYQEASNEINVKAMYFEMNEFDINTDEWYIDGFAFSQDGGLDLDDMEWLCEYESESDSQFVIRNFEKLQAAFENIEPNREDLQNARDWCEQIIIARFMELIYTAHNEAKSRELTWANMPIYFTEHAYDFVLKSE